MEYTIYFISNHQGKKMYLVNLPDEDNWLSGVGFQSDKTAAGTCPTLEDAHKVIAWLNEDPSDRTEYLVEAA
jgi:hypothetical protein